MTLSRRDFMKAGGIAAAVAALAACAPPIANAITKPEIYLIAEFHPLIHLPYTYKLQPEIFNELDQLISSGSINTVLMESDYGFWSGVNGTAADYATFMYDHIGKTQAERHNLVTEWNSSLKEGKYPFGELQSFIIKNNTQNLQYYAPVAARFVHDNIYLAGIDDPGLLYNGQTLVEKMHEFEFSNRTDETEYLETVAAYNDSVIERNYAMADNIKMIEDAVKEAYIKGDVNQMVKGMVLVVGGTHLEGPAPECSLKTLLEEKGYNVHLIYPGSYQPILDKYIKSYSSLFNQPKKALALLQERQMASLLQPVPAYS